nr:hypothetical protein Iba_chr14aCG27540 [Ipomoea batatas]
MGTEEAAASAPATGGAATAAATTAQIRTAANAAAKMMPETFLQAWMVPSFSEVLQLLQGSGIAIPFNPSLCLEFLERNVDQQLPIASSLQALLQFDTEVQHPVTSFKESKDNALTSTPPARALRTLLVLTCRVESKLCKSTSTLQAASYELIISVLYCRLLIPEVDVSAGFLLLCPPIIPISFLLISTQATTQDHTF